LNSKIKTAELLREHFGFILAGRSSSFKGVFVRRLEIHSAFDRPDQNRTVDTHPEFTLFVRIFGFRCFLIGGQQQKIGDSYQPLSSKHHHLPD